MSAAWKDFVTASLLGTERGGGTAALPAALENTLGPAERLAFEARFLTRAGALGLWRRSGWRPGRGEVAAHPPAPPESLSLINPTSTAHLRAMLGGHCAEVLPEWLGEAARSGKRMPPEALPAVLEWARQNRSRHPLAAVGGERARWLAALNPAWNFAGDDAPAHWETGGREQRVAILRRWRATDPALAGEKLAAVWKTESADARQAFLGVLAEDVSGADADFLEGALDDRSKEVRSRAAELLGRLPESAFVARMIARAEPLLVFKPGGLLRRAALEITLPGEPDAAARRDGLDPKILLTPSRTVGELSRSLAQTLAAIPLRHWTERFQQTPEALLKAAARHESADAVISGWAMATLAQRDTAWNRAFFDELPDLGKHLFVSHGGFFDLLPEAYQIEQAIAQLRANPLTAKTGVSGPTPYYQHRLTQLPGDLPEEVARLVLEQLRRIPRGEAEKLPNYFLHNTAQGLAAKTPPSLLAAFAAEWPADVPAFARAFDLLAFRRDALAALAQP